MQDALSMQLVPRAPSMMLFRWACQLDARSFHQSASSLQQVIVQARVAPAVSETASEASHVLDKLAT